jgi:hypothetical protein
MKIRKRYSVIDMNGKIHITHASKPVANAIKRSILLQEIPVGLNSKPKVVPTPDFEIVLDFLKSIGRI